MTDSSDRFPYPPNAVVAVVAGDDDPDRFVRLLAQAGFEGDATVGVLHGEADARSLDIDQARLVVLKEQGASSPHFFAKGSVESL